MLLGTWTACALALLFAILGAAAGASPGPGAGQDLSISRAQTYEGMVTCSRCGARHSVVLGQTAADCVRSCVRDRASFVLVGPDATYVLDGDLGVLGRLAGQRARIVGELSGNTIKISSASES